MRFRCSSMWMSAQRPATTHLLGPIALVRTSSQNALSEGLGATTPCLSCKGDLGQSKPLVAH